MIDHPAIIEQESRRFLSAITAITEAGTSLDAVAVPACPDWTASDLLWHLTEVQYFWATMVGHELTDYAAAPRLSRPADDQLPALFGEQMGSLLSVLADRSADDRCWSWHPAGGSIGWVRRRQAHEAMIHRVDAEQAAATAGAPGLTSIDEAVATDGVDEMLQVMLAADPLPSWGSFSAGGDLIELVTPQRRWRLRLGEVVGENEDGPQALPALLIDPDDGSVDEPSATVTASAAAIDLWLWRRNELPADAVDGDQAAVGRLHNLAEVN